jgi:CubicO group peptidase (beta-lactamase class C family)
LVLDMDQESLLRPEIEMHRLIHRRGLLKLFGAGSIGITVPGGQARAAIQNSDIEAQLDAAMRAYVQRDEFAGAVLVTRGGEPLLRSAYGPANRLLRKPNTPETGYQIASLTKGFTALACVQLQEAGKLTLDDPISRYLPEVMHAALNGVAVTIRHLLAHTAGVPDFLGFYDVANPLSYPRDRDELVADIIVRELEFTPGTQYAYSNSGYIYAGMIIERVSGQSYESYLKERILGPAGMTQTFIEEPPDPAPPLAMGYSELEGILLPTSEFGRVDLAWAAGGITSTLDDMLRWHEALLTENLASRAAIQEMYVPVTPEYGLGWEVKEVADHLSTGHEGHTIGYDAMLDRFIAEDVVIVQLCNRQFAPVREISAELAGLVFAN